MQLGLCIASIPVTAVNPLIYQLYQFQVIHERQHLTSIGQIILSSWPFHIPSVMDAFNGMSPLDTKIFRFNIIIYK